MQIDPGPHSWSRKRDKSRRAGEASDSGDRRRRIWCEQKSFGFWKKISFVWMDSENKSVECGQKSLGRMLSHSEISLGMNLFSDSIQAMTRLMWWWQLQEQLLIQKASSPSRPSPSCSCRRRRRRGGDRSMTSQYNSCCFRGLVDVFSDMMSVVQKSKTAS